MYFSPEIFVFGAFPAIVNPMRGGRATILNGVLIANSLIHD
jgi:hypothetical protein